jgi:hypothetical protein
MRAFKCPISEVHVVVPRLRLFIALLLFTYLVLPATSVAAVAVDLDGALRAEWHPDRLRLEPGEQGTVHMTIENVASETLHVALAFLQAKSAGACSGNVSPASFDLGPGASQVARVEIRSWASLQDHGNDCTIEVQWGRNLTMDPKGYVDRDTAEGQQRITLPIDDDFSSVIITIIEVVAVVVVLIVTIAYLMPRWRGSGGNKGT